MKSTRGLGNVYQPSFRDRNGGIGSGRDANGAVVRDDAALNGHIGWRRGASAERGNARAIVDDLDVIQDGGSGPGQVGSGGSGSPTGTGDGAGSGGGDSGGGNAGECHSPGHRSSRARHDQVARQAHTETPYFAGQK